MAGSLSYYWRDSLAWAFNFIYAVLLFFASPWLIVVSWRTGKYREGFAAKCLGHVPPRSGHQPCIWLHAVSVGEVNLLGGVICEWNSRRSDIQFVITTTTQTGYALARKKYADHHVCYCPLDFSWAVNTAFDRLRPDLLVLAELELWPNLIAAAHRRRTPVVVINGRLSEASYRGYRRIRWAIARMLRQLTVVAVQNRDYADRFINLGMPRERVIVTGSIKFDNANTDRQNSQTISLREMVGLRSEHTVFLAGSTQDPEETLALNTFAQLHVRFPSLRLIVVPRHPERFAEVHTLLSASEFQYVRRSEIGGRVSADDWQVLLVDTVGELGAWWGTADIAFVGGSMGSRGGQNMLEPAAYGATVCFGPNTQNFRDVVSMLLSVNGAQVVSDGEVLSKFVLRCLEDRPFGQAMGQRAQSLVIRHRGATKRTVDILEPLIAGDRPRHTS